MGYNGKPRRTVPASSWSASVQVVAHLLCFRCAQRPRRLQLCPSESRAGRWWPREPRHGGAAL